MPPRRLVLLGASNLTRAISTVVETGWLRWGRPLDVLAALGHGRSYGMTSTVLGRTLPGIVQCGLWRDLESRSPAPAAALVTDIGNDLLYGAPVERIVQWVAWCLEALARAGAVVVMTRLPLANLEGLPEWRFRLLRSVLFPRCRLARETLTRRARQLDERLGRLAEEQGVTLVGTWPAWYGFDPIHIKLRHWRAAWAQIVCAGSEAEAPRRAAGSLARWLYLRTRLPEQHWLLGIERRRAQPSGRLRDGTTISLY